MELIRKCVLKANDLYVILGEPNTSYTKKIREATLFENPDDADEAGKARFGLGAGYEVIELTGEEFFALMTK